MSVIGDRQVNPNGSVSSIHTEKLNKQLVVENVTIVEVTKRVEVPKLIDVPTEQIMYVTKEENTLKYNTVLKETIRYIPKELDTTKYNVKEEETIKFIPKEVEVELPKLVEKIYEVPVKKEVVMEVISIKDMEQLQNLMKAVPEVIRSLGEAVVAVSALMEDLRVVQTEVVKLRDIKLVEDVVRVPKLEYHTVEVERVVWKDVIRERPI